jgi:hypothetical protein
MHRISMSPFRGGIATLALIAVTVSQSVDAEEPQASEVTEVLCSVTDEQIVAATARQQVTLDTQDCTVSLKRMVEFTFSNVQKAYAAFYKQTHLNPAQAADVSMLLVRRQLLSGSWDAVGVEHYTVSDDPALLTGIEERLHAYLTPEQIASLKAYEETIPARTLVEPVVSRLEKKARPLAELQYEEALQKVQQFFAEWIKRAPAEKPADPRQRCIDSNARMNRRDEGIREILARSLDEEQLEIAEGYYRDLFERRARVFKHYERKLASDGAAICAIPAH